MRGPDGELLLDFRYRVLRVWQMPPEVFLSGGLAVLPLAAVARTRRSDLTRILNRIGERLETEATPSQADLLRTATFVLMGLKFDQSLVEKIMSQNVLELSSTYQALQAKGIEKGIAQGEQKWRSEEARRMILRLGAKRLGEPDGAAITTIENIDSLERLEAIMERLLSVETWQELLA